MKDCWPDGDLRAYIDGELSPDSREAIAAHMEACSACGKRYRELSARAVWVSDVMALSRSLSEVAPPLPVRRLRPRLWPAAILPLAAVIAIAFLMLPKRAPVRPAPVVAEVTVPPAPVETAAPVVHSVVHRPAPRRPAPDEEFVRLDDDPIETATIVRISADNGALQADLIVGPDGRAHAIRIVSNQ